MCDANENEMIEFEPLFEVPFPATNKVFEQFSVKVFYILMDWKRKGINFWTSKLDWSKNVFKSQFN